MRYEIIYSVYLEITASQVELDLSDALTPHLNIALSWGNLSSLGESDL